MGRSWAVHSMVSRRAWLVCDGFPEGPPSRPPPALARAARNLRQRLTSRHGNALRHASSASWALEQCGPSTGSARRAAAEPGDTCAWLWDDLWAGGVEKVTRTRIRSPRAGTGHLADRSRPTAPDSPETDT